MRSFVSLFVAGSLAVMVAGCGSSLECGAGTHSSGGFCVQDTPMTCDPETADLKDGVCVAKPNGGTCGPGTKVNPANPDECIPDCGGGTSLDPVTKKCVPNSALIKPDKIETPADEDDDPMNTGGVPINFTLPALAQSYIIAGVIGSPVADTDGVLWADWDGWKFTTTGPTLLQIEGLDVSHIRAAFFIAPADDVSLNGIERFGYNAEADQANRKLFLPRSGDWVLMVSDAENFNAFWNQNTGGNFVQHGGSQYIVRGIGLLQRPDDIGDIVVAARHGVPIYVKSVAQVKVGQAASVTPSGASRAWLAEVFEGR